MTWRNTTKMDTIIPKNGLKEKASANFFSSFFDYQGSSKYISAKFCEKKMLNSSQEIEIYPQNCSQIFSK